MILTFYIKLMFVAEVKTEFLERIEVVLNKDNLSINDKKTIIGKLFIEFEKKNKSQLIKLVVPQVKKKRVPTEYNNFIKQKMDELKEEVVQSKFRFKVASKMWQK